MAAHCSSSLVVLLLLVFMCIKLDTIMNLPPNDMRPDFSSLKTASLYWFPFNSATRPVTASLTSPMLYRS